MSEPVRVLFVCLGNICRSPLAEGVFRAKVEAAGLDRAIQIDSAGTGAWHVGEPPDPRSVAVGRRHGLDLSAQRARQLTREDLSRFDVLIAMDASNRRNIIRLAPGGDVEPLRGRLWLMRNFEFDDDGAGDDVDVPDPWSGGPDGFLHVYKVLDRACDHLLTWVRAEHALG